jgi:hypothetical protein
MSYFFSLTHPAKWLEVSERKHNKKYFSLLGSDNTFLSDKNMNYRQNNDRIKEYSEFVGL